LINRWNQLLEGLVDPNDPAERAEAESEVEQLIDVKLKPLCRFEEEDLSDSRIYRVNALGALQQRIADAPSAAALAETRIPAFEEGLAQFLVADRFKARQAKDLAVLDSTIAAVGHYVQIQERDAGQSLEALEARYRDLKPKLDRLLEVGKHIENYLKSKASEVATELCRSFDTYLDEQVIPPLEGAIQKFNLGRADGIFVSFDAALDLFRDENKSFRRAIETHLEGQVGRYLKPKITAWFESLRGSQYLRDVTREVQAELQAEAGNYVSIVEEIEGHVDSNKHTAAVQDQLKEWLQGPALLSGTMNELGLDLAPLVGSLLIDVASHMMLNFLPGLGILISGVLILVRRDRMRAKLRGQLYQGIKDQMPGFRANQQAAIREALNSGFGKMNDAIREKIAVDVLLISSSLEALIKEKSEETYSAQVKRDQLAELTRRVQDEADQLRALMV
jgi:hypothetical protein